MRILRRIVIYLIIISIVVSTGVESNKMILSDSSERQEIQELRTSNTKTYQLSDGTYECIAYAEDIHYLDSNGKFKDIDCSITDEKTNSYYRYKNAANSWSASFANSLSDTNAVRIQKDEYVLSFNLIEGNNNSSVQKTQVLSGAKSDFYREISHDNRAVIFQEAIYNSGIDIIYSIRSSAIKEEIVLKERCEQNAFEFALNLQSITAKQEGKEIVFRGSSNNEVFRIGELFMIDSNGKYSDRVFVELIYEGDSTKIRILADKDFLLSDDTTYPVVIDPSITVTGSSDTYDTCVDEQYPSSNYYLSENLWTGGKTGTNTMRTYIKFALPTSIGNYVTRATLRIKKNLEAAPGIRAYRVTSSWSSNTVTWNNKPGYTTSGCTSTCSLDSGSWYKIDATTMVRNWITGTYSNYGFVLKEPSETNSSQKTRWYSSDAPSPNKPELVINYVNEYESRPYQPTITQGVNCMGYALEYDEFINRTALGITESDMYGMTTSQMLTYINNKSQIWMTNHLSSSGYSALAAFDSNISQQSPGWFRVVLRVGFVDEDGDGVFDAGELWDGHWRYQTYEDYGVWAEKHGTNSSQKLPLSNGVNPTSSAWIFGGYIYDSAGKYYQIKDSRNISW